MIRDTHEIRGQTTTADMVPPKTPGENACSVWRWDLIVMTGECGAASIWWMEATQHVMDTTPPLHMHPTGNSLAAVSRVLRLHTFELTRCKVPGGNRESQQGAGLGQVKAAVLLDKSSRAACDKGHFILQKPSVGGGAARAAHSCRYGLPSTNQGHYGSWCHIQGVLKHAQHGTSEESEQGRLMKECQVKNAWTWSGLCRQVLEGCVG